MTGAAGLDGVAGWMADLLSAIGPIGVGVVIFIENLFPPIPSEAVLPAAGFLASQGEFGIVPAIVWATVGSVVGALVLYGLGRLVGDARVTAIIDRIPLMSADDATRAWDAFDRHGSRAVLWGRMVPGVRSLVSIPAGARRMPLGGFIPRTLAGSAAWNTLLIGAGFWLGDAYGSTAVVAEWANRLVYLAVAGCMGWFIVRRLRRPAKTPIAIPTSIETEPIPVGTANGIGTPDAAAVPPPVEIPGPDDAAVRVLLVEDDRSLGPAIQKYLEVRGYGSVWIQRVHPALDELIGGGYSVVITDYDLPDGSGIEVVEAAAVPVIVCTGRAEPEYRDRLLAAGAQTVLIKPFGLDELASALSSATVTS
ncbi:MAG: VTT domain-containing protein [Acidimicrobiales bacterium]|nr:VTT domain-containing protein [Acidimicrobiales bacterium]